MMDGLCLGAFDAIFRTVRQVFGRFSDGRSGKVSVFSQKNWNLLDKLQPLLAEFLRMLLPFRFICLAKHSGSFPSFP